MENHYEKALFAGGCFWCMQPAFDNLRGVIETKVGYTGGHKENPTYEEVCRGTTGHAEAILVIFDPKLISYEELVEVFFRNIDPTQENGQFADRGSQYRTEIFYFNEAQKLVAEKVKEKVKSLGYFNKPIVTKITPASAFYEAEEYHQKYYLKNPLHYQIYKEGSGRGPFLRKMWGGK
ncbi:MAG: peptide-methionine (S)-S-oxide reductase MsrA [Leptospiraceae bacterium]|nr:peptide-methionine (S)-S-oxide reductase MsrA [Leptospiraceae bacterium]